MMMMIDDQNSMCHHEIPCIFLTQGRRAKDPNLQGAIKNVMNSMVTSPIVE